jgi:cation diffusion facilitator CzcD-associated flavoprotein CzcO
MGIPEHVDVLIVGAGLSGIGAAARLQRELPDATLAIVEARDTIGGTWDLFRYPGVRSDSDMFTLGYDFRPWTEAAAIADGAAILKYVQETARDEGLLDRISFGVRVTEAAWDSTDACWTVTATAAAGGTVEVSCSFLWVCSGYFRYEEGYTPRFEGMGDYRGRLVHPQLWPADLDVSGRRVVVIGSGATAVTLVPALAATAAHVTMLQRTPTWIATVPSRDRVAERLQRVLPMRAAHALARWKSALQGMGIYWLSRHRPRFLRSFLLRRAAAQLPADFDLGTHLTPAYDPWDQRLCAVPDGDLFRTLSSGRADIVTDGIERFTAAGIALASGRTLPADVVVTATGLTVLALGGIRLAVDGEPVRLADTLAYKGAMLSGVPNLALTIGYTNASWTLKADLVARYVCRVLKHLRRTGTAVATPVAPPTDRQGDLVPLIDLQAGYVRRALGELPKQGARTPWRLRQNYVRDLVTLRYGPVTDAMRFERAGARVRVGEPAR